MATTYAFPLNGSAVHEHHGFGHARSHNRKNTIERLPLQPLSSNGSLGAVLKREPTNSHLQSPIHHSHSHLVPQKPLTVATHQRLLSNAQLSTQELPSAMPSAKPTGTQEPSAGPWFVTPAEQPGNDYGSSHDIMISSHDSHGGHNSSGGAVRNWITAREVVASVLVPLPFLLVSLPYPVRPPPTSTLNQPVDGLLAKRSLESLAGSETPFSVPSSAFLSACTLTSATLLLIGLGGKVAATYTSLDRRKQGDGEDEVAEHTKVQLNVRGAIRMLGTALRIGLPFYAAANLGGHRIALIMLVALAGDLMKTEGARADLTKIEGWKRLLSSRRWTFAALGSQFLLDVGGITTKTGTAIWTGYLAIGLSLFALPPPSIPSSIEASVPALPKPRSSISTSALFSKRWDAADEDAQMSSFVMTASPLIRTAEDAHSTLLTGAILGLLTILGFFLSPQGLKQMSKLHSGWIMLVSFAAAMSLLIARPSSLNSRRKIGLILGCFFIVMFLKTSHGRAWTSFAYEGVFIGVSWLAGFLDTRSLFSASHSEHHSHHHPSGLVHASKPSVLTAFLLRTFQHWPLLYSILAEKDSRRIFYFMILNFVFMLVQTFYGIATGSLGLLSDSIHMFFDCLALVVGLCASVMSKWPPSARFPYGYGKMDTLAGFANGIFLMLISVEIVYEAIERLVEGSEMQRLGELLTVSGLGLVVNLIGIMAFDHAHHGHSHGGHDHSHANGHAYQGHGHDHDNHHNHDDHHSSAHTHDHTPFSSIPPTPAKPHTPPTDSGHQHHHHHHGNENMHGIFLHILADTLGSVAVVISTLLIHFYGWSGFDPLASCLIAILIFASAIPLVASSAKTLLLTVPAGTEFDLREALAGVSGLRGLVGYAVPRFWLEEGEKGQVLGVMHVVAGRGADLEDVRERAVGVLRERNMDVLVQVEREGEGRCWCGGGTKVG
ncbi:Cation efflux protein transmembrane domain [Lasallia pustulata]|uniref:Zinc transporter n=1 Tax=Lasallia pustulata TaxID=136370 RepID=A0A1W5D806_9LECA|nr:Cation efflux protein transmembrane domain [Lasallia pustulata]